MLHIQYVVILLVVNLIGIYPDSSQLFEKLGGVLGTSVIYLRVLRFQVNILRVLGGGIFDANLVCQLLGEGGRRKG